jgi:hypothetical protein
MGRVQDIGCREEKGVQRKAEKREFLEVSYLEG